jgi:uncharacterized zinc-type alcohol dehydrogenase-like protein
METTQVKAYGTESTTAPLKQLNIDRRLPAPKDVEIDILYCGVCHSDLHTARNDWGGSVYPVVPGHENRRYESKSWRPCSCRMYR